MVKIIFSRVGRKNQPLYRVVVMDKQKDPWGDALEILGNYNPHTKELNIKTDRVTHWIEQGAQPSATVHNLLIEQGIIKDKKVRVSTVSKKRQAKLDEKTKEKAAKEAEAAEAAKAAAEAEAKPEEQKEDKAADTGNDKKEEAPAAEEKPDDAKTEEKKDEAPKDEPKSEESK